MASEAVDGLPDSPRPLLCVGVAFGPIPAALLSSSPLEPPLPLLPFPLLPLEVVVAIDPEGPDPEEASAITDDFPDAFPESEEPELIGGPVYCSSEDDVAAVAGSKPLEGPPSCWS